MPSRCCWSRPRSTRACVTISDTDPALADARARLDLAQSGLAELGLHASSEVETPILTSRSATRWLASPRARS